MAYQIIDAAASPLLVVELTEDVSNAEILRMMADLFNSPGFAAKDQFIDFSGVTAFDVTVEGMETYDAVASNRAERQLARADRKCAVLAPDDLSFGTARTLQVRAEGRIDMQVFRTRAEVEAWLPHLKEHLSLSRVSRPNNG